MTRDHSMGTKKNMANDLDIMRGGFNAAVLALALITLATGLLFWLITA
jgi:hypothetical protein